MKILASQGFGQARLSARRGHRAFTLTETLIAGTVFLLAIAGVLVANTFGMRVMGITQPKLAASGEVRNTMTKLITDIRSAKFVHVGNGSLSAFTNAAAGTPKEGNAIELYNTADTNVFIRFFRDTADKKLKRFVSGATNATIVANAISNSIVFRAEEWGGMVLTNEQNNLVIRIALQYYELDGTATPVGTNNYYKSFTLTNWIAHRAR